MSARTRKTATVKRADDPRVVRSRAVAVDAARSLFLRKGYAGVTMEEIAASAGLARRTLYNTFADKRELFTRIVEDTIKQAGEFAEGLDEGFFSGITAATLRPALGDLGRRLALGILRPEVIALRRLLVGETREFPGFAADYYDRAPGQVLEALASGFRRLRRSGLLRVANPRLAADQFAYLVAGEALDRAILVGKVPPRARVRACAREGVRTFLARYERTGRREARVSPAC